MCGSSLLTFYSGQSRNDTTGTPSTVPPMSEETEDSWTAPDKIYHVIFCFTLTLLFSLLASLKRHRFLRRHSTVIAATFSLLAGAAKEFADHLGYFQSSGASFKDAVADFAGVLIACSLLSLPRFLRRKPKSDDDFAGVALV